MFIANKSKESTLWCIAQCLKLLDSEGAKPKDVCNYNVKNGNAYELFVNAFGLDIKDLLNLFPHYYRLEIALGACN
jgi:hypothetical protein